MDDAMNPILLSRDGAVATVTLNRPDQLNAWTAAMEIELRRVMAQLAADDTVRAIVLTGNGRAFCAGIDVQALKGLADGENDISRPAPEVQAAMGEGDFEQRYSYLLGVPQPIICALNGPAAGVGIVLALYCDIRYASSRAKLAASFARRGLVAEHGIGWVLPRIIGLPRALEWLLTGRTLAAEEAERIGLVSAVFEADSFAAEVADRARVIATTVSPRSARIIKRQLHESAAQSLAYACQVAAVEVTAAIVSEDFREGVQHFLEKRPAAFTGR